MVDATLERGTGNFLSSSSTTLTLPQVQSETIRKSAGLLRVPFPISDSYASIMADLLGVSRDIVVTGEADISSVGGDIYRFARDLASIKLVHTQTLVTGDQGDTGGGQTGFVYTPISLNIQSDGTLLATASRETITTYVNDSSVTFNSGNPNTVTYSLTLYEGSSTTSF